MRRRGFLQATGSALVGGSACGWFPALAIAAATAADRKRQCILLWMSGGLSQLDTFDMKPDHANGGEFKEIATHVPGLRISEHLPKLAALADHLVVIRGVSTSEGDHVRGTYLMRTGQKPSGPVRYPAIGSALSKELGDEAADLPNYVSIAPTVAIRPDAFSPGFLGPRYAAATVGAINGFGKISANQNEGFAELGVDFLNLPTGVTSRQAASRVDLWKSLQDSFLAERSTRASLGQNTVYRRAMQVMNSEAAGAFDLSAESDKIREPYGRGSFGQGCLLARRLIERGVPFVEVSLGSGGLGRDTHQNNFETVKRLSMELDAGWSTLMVELQKRGLLESTTILWRGEFGRTPTINGNAGRDHFPNAWSCVFAGGGIQGGGAYGATSEDGSEVTEGKVDTASILATLCEVVGVSPDQENITNLGRPIKISEGEPIADVLE